MNLKNKFGSLAMAFAFLANAMAALPANATTATANFNGHVKLVAACTASATNPDFGTLPGLIQGTETVTSTLTVKCTKNAAYSMVLVPGSGAMSGTTNPSDKVTYTATLATGSGTGTGSNQSYTINLALTPQTTPSAQDYSETRSVTITY